LLKSGKAKLPLGKERILSAILSPKDNFVAYTVDYSLRIRPIAKVPPEVAKLIKDAMAKRETMQNAKQMGLAILMYSGDCDDLTPPKDGLSDIIQPYLRMNIPGFVYTLEGGKNLGEIANPAETEMGYINGPGGRAIVYVDGHVSWKPDK
jgi:prepilin-type processing-associated H-X9-DG protein